MKFVGHVAMFVATLIAMLIATLGEAAQGVENGSLLTTF
jgi:hypothetical protein